MENIFSTSFFTSIVQALDFLQVSSLKCARILKPERLKKKKITHKNKEFQNFNFGKKSSVVAHFLP